MCVLAVYGCALVALAQEGLSRVRARNLRNRLEGGELPDMWIESASRTLVDWFAS